MKRCAKGMVLVFLPLAIAPISAAVYEVGPGKAHEAIGDVPWETLTAGDMVLIYYREEPYREKWVICRQGTETEKIVIRGMPDERGHLPVVEGIDATTRAALNFWNEGRSIIKIGGANNPPDCMPQNIVIENLDIKSGRPPYSFTGRSGPTDYSGNAAAIYVEKGENITIRNCILRDCGNGFFCASGASNVLVEGCFIYDNGIEDSIYEHNNYTEANGIVFQNNRFGPLRSGCPGNNLKDRSSGCVIRYNWIESGNRQLDLVDSNHSEIYGAPEYRATYVYGNILIELDGADNSQVCHYGGDSGDTDRYRKGTLYFYNNTVVSTRTGNTTLLRLSSMDESCDCRNNIVYTTAAGSHLAITNDEGTVNLRNNWLKENWRKSHSNPDAVVNDVSGNIEGDNPGFMDSDDREFGLTPGSPCINSGTELADAALTAHNVVKEYVKHQRAHSRFDDGQLDMGALEYDPDTDSDAIPDRWELQHSGNLATMTASSDNDGDGLLDWQERIAGTDPTDAFSLLAITGVKVENGSDVVIQWRSTGGVCYTVGFATDLAQGSFVHATSGILATPPLNTHIEVLDGLERAYYRIEAEE